MTTVRDMSMRMQGLAVTVIWVLAAAAPAGAQGVLEGPIAAPGPVPSKSPAASKARKAHKKAPSHATKTAPSAPVLAGDGPDRDARPATGSPAKLAEDPLSVGMKWNGSNDNSSQTRVQNYNGSASGTGAEVGLKLHF